MLSYGNYVMIDHGRGEFTLYGHMREGRVRSSSTSDGGLGVK